MARAAAQPAQESAAHHLRVTSDRCRDLNLTVERRDTPTRANHNAVRPPCVRDESTDRQPAIGPERGATRGDLCKGAVNPLEARGNECLNIAPRASLAVSLWHHRLEAVLWVDAQREASCAWATNQAIRSGTHGAEFRMEAASLGA